MYGSRSREWDWFYDFMHSRGFSQWPVTSRVRLFGCFASYTGEENFVVTYDEGEIRRVSMLAGI